MSDCDQAYMDNLPTREEYELAKRNYEDKMSNPNTAEEIETKDKIEYIAKEYGQGYEAELFTHIEELLQEHTTQTLDRLKEGIISDISGFGIPKEFMIEDVKALFDGLNPQEIGEVKGLLRALDKIEEVSDG